MNKTTSILLVAVIAGVTGFYVYKDWQSTKTEVEQPANNAQQEQGLNNSGDSNSQPTEPAAEVTNIPAPDLSRSINVTANLPEETKSKAISDIKKLSGELSTDQYNAGRWIQLGALRKLIGDYEGAKDCWVYAGAISPSNYIPFNNLGDLYAYYIKDNQKAEASFLRAIKISPDKIFVYNSLYDFYRDVMKDDVKAKAILERGISSNPNTSESLKYLLDNF